MKVLFILAAIYKEKKNYGSKYLTLLKLTRGASCSPHQVIIGAGVQYLLGILIGLIKDDYFTAAIENPGYEKAEYIFEDYNFKISHIPVTEDGLSIKDLKKLSSSIVYISPSHQYPLGSVMPINKRFEMIEWAKNSNSLIIEDDYDSHIRYESMPVPCLQGLDKSDCVIYLGSFSKLLTPSLRISYMILPEKLLQKYGEIKTRYTQSCSKIDQLTLAKFIEENHMERHLRKISRIYKKKIYFIIKYINDHYKDIISVVNADSGLHIVIEILTHKDSKNIIEIANKNNISLDVVNSSNNKALISLNYSGIELEKIPEFINALVSFFF
jgi:GntR family transcriptional regulator/MocR family aminotransferase